jgi:hypothetical protein
MAPTQPISPSEEPYRRHWLVPQSWSEWIASIIILAIVALCAFGAGRASLTYDLNNLKGQFEKTQKDYKNLTDDAQRERDQNRVLTETLTGVQGQLKDVFSLYRTIVIKGNETTSVASGYFTIGVVGAPGNDKVMLNVNGHQQEATVGTTIDVPAPSSCRVEVRAIDMFKATLVTSCMPAKP